MSDVSEIDDDDIAAAYAMINILRADDGKGLRKLLKSLRASDTPESKELRGLLFVHPLLRELIPH
jgi:hypothetical protein